MADYKYASKRPVIIYQLGVWGVGAILVGVMKKIYPQMGDQNLIYESIGGVESMISISFSDIKMLWLLCVWGGGAGRWGGGLGGLEARPQNPLFLFSLPLSLTLHYHHHHPKQSADMPSHSLRQCKTYKQMHSDSSKFRHLWEVF